jgi:mannobiose 2-epimerase
MTEEWRLAHAAALRPGLTRNVIQAWFPRSIDRADGGFLSSFDHRWRPYGAQERLLEFQARQTRTAARLGVALPADETWPAVTRHGVRYLDQVMRDKVDGGWFALTTRGGQPLLGGTKHAHGTAYLISAGVEAFRLTGDALALAIAHDAFSWLERTLHDADYGGYHGWATRSGKVIRGTADLPADLRGNDHDHLGHGIGFKDANVHSDLLEALTLLAGVSDQPLVATRLAEVYDALLKHFITPSGAVHYLAHADLSPLPGTERYGYPLQSGHRLFAAAKVLGRSQAEAGSIAGRMLDHVLAFGWDAERGGFVEAGPAAEPLTLAGTRLRVRKRPWWVQTEGAKLLLQFVVDDSAPARYRATFDRLMEVLQREFIDRRRGGWEMSARADWPRRLRLPGRGLPKSDLWKDASHESDMYLTAIRMLRGLAPGTAID